MKMANYFCYVTNLVMEVPSVVNQVHVAEIKSVDEYPATFTSNVDTPMLQQPIIITLNCPVCSFKTTSACDLDKHLNNHASPCLKKLACKECASDGMTNCGVHSDNKTKHTNSPTFYLPKKERKKRMERKKKKKNISCSPESDIAGNQMSQLNPVLQRIRKHHYCNVCSYSAAKQVQLNKHKHLFHKSTKFHNCTNCHYQTLNIGDFEEHLRTHAIQEPLQCSKCSFSTPWKLDFEKHLSKHVEMKTRRNNHNSQTKTHKCVLCSYQTTDELLFRKHALDHKDEYVFLCDICTYMTTKELVFEMHLSEHNKLLELRCRLCSFKTPSVVDLERHELWHTDDISFVKEPLSQGVLYKCNLCKYETEVNRLLQKHYFIAHLATKVRTVSKPFVCNKCNFSSVLKYDYYNHKRLH